MKKWQTILLSVLLLFRIVPTQAQWDVPITQFWAAKNYFNPSFAGETGNIRVSGIYKHQWAGIEKAPKHYLMSADMPTQFWGMQHGVGILSYTNSVGDKQNTVLAAQYTFKQKVGKGVLNIGIQAGMSKLNFDAASLRLTTDSTKGYRKTIEANVVDKKTIDLNAGISWTTKNFYIGMAAMHISQPAFHSINTGKTTTDSTLTKIPLTYNFIAGYNITAFHPLFEMQPAVFAQSDLTDIRIHTALRMVYDKKYSLGASWRSKDGYSFFAGATIQEIEFGYAYDLPASGIAKESGGNHEISVRYQIPIDLFNRKPQPHKSIRLL